CPFAYIPQLEEIDRKDRKHTSQKAKREWTIPQQETNLSGGEETRRKIAAALSSSAQLIMADEPTSHLDVQGIEKLEQALDQFKGAIIIISHDRELLNRLCTSIWEVEDGMVHVFAGNYDAYLEQKQQLKARAWFEYEQY